MKADKFNFFVPLDFEKGKGEEGGLVKISGVASTDAEDSDQEELIPAGFDFAPLLKSGFFNWNHQAKTSSKAICGEPTAAKIIDNGKSFYIEGVIYPNEEGKNVVALAETLEKYSPNRRLGFSIEGQAIERDALNPKKVLRARITGVAITQSPKNPNTLMNIVKGEYSEEFVEGPEDEKEDEVDKAMMVNVDVNPPSVEGVKSEEELNQVLKKSDIYNQIYNRYTTDFNKAEQVYYFINQVKSKNMAKDITAEVLEKAFSLLDQSFEKSEDQKQLADYDQKDDDKDEDDDNIEINKGEDEEDVSEMEKSEDVADDDDDDNDDDEGDEDDDFEKAMNAEIFAKSLFESGQEKDDVVKALTSVGFSLTLAETTCSNCIAQANAEKEGGKITALKKSEDDTLGELKAFLDKKFAATSTILKSMEQKNEALEEELSMLKKANENFLQAPQRRKSTTTVNALERFEKSADGSSLDVYDSRNAGDMRLLTTKLMTEAEAARANGQPNPMLEKAVMDLEIAKSTDFGAIQPMLRRMNIAVN